MPKTNQSKGIAQNTRKRTNARGNQQKPRCKASTGAKTHTPKIIANSLFALTLTPLIGLEVEQKFDKPKKVYGSDDYNKMYKDLFECVQTGLTIINGKGSPWNPINEGYDIAFSLKYILNVFKHNLLPEDFEFNIDEVDGEYYFTVYSPFFGTKENWNFYEIKPIVKYLEKTDTKLYNLFIKFLKCFMTITEINDWRDFFYAEEQIEEQLNNWFEDRAGDVENEEEENIMQEEYKLAFDCVQDYKKGEPAQYIKKVGASEFHNVDYFIKKIKTLGFADPVIDWMLKTCEFLKLSCGSVHQFVYQEFQDSDDGDGLAFYDQHTIIWDAEDYYTSEIDAMVESTAIGIGVVPPVMHFHLKKDSKKYDFGWIEKSKNWILEFDKVYQGFLELNKIIKKL